LWGYDGGNLKEGNRLEDVVVDWRIKNGPSVNGMEWFRPDSSDSRLGQVEGCAEHGSNIYASIKCGI
jgi:hypothetical protein